jgi:hypothetical protein
MPTELIIAIIGIGGTIGAGALGFINGRSKIRIDSISAEATADLARAQASGEVITFLRDEVQRLQLAHEQSLTRMAELSTEVNAYRQQLAQFESIVLTLPDEYRGRFAEVLARKGARHPKVSSGD